MATAYELIIEMLNENPHTDSVPTPDPTPIGKCTITPSKDYAVNIRKYPDIEFSDDSLAGTLNVGVKREIIGKVADSENRVWYKIGTEQFVSSLASIKLEGDCTAIPDIDPENPAPDNCDELRQQLTAMELERNIWQERTERYKVIIQEMVDIGSAALIP